MIKRLLVVALLASSLQLFAKSSKQLFIEAESFQNRGGWVIDPQFSQQMGSPYLLAHGMGKPVENTSTNVNFPALGAYHAWVRTKNWVPGNWEAPGRFQLIVNGKIVQTVLGTQEGWSWQYAGEVTINKIASTIELQDLTGFEGRCDAIYFSTLKVEPPSEPAKLAEWRKRMTGETAKPPTTVHYDFVVVGGGIAGCAAAIAAAEQGLKVAIVHDRPVYLYGREDSAKFGESWPKYGDLWSSAQGDNRVMGASVLWRSMDAKAPVSFPEVPWAMEVAKGHSATKGVWQWEYSDNNLNQVDDAEQIRDHMLQAIYGSFYNAKKESANSNLALEWVAYISGKRESRRLVGDYIYTFNDEKLMRKFPDAVVVEERNVDVHFQEILKNPERPDFLSEAMFYNAEKYYIPYRSLYSKNISNLLMAGRCFSCSHVGLGGPRVMNTTGQMGVAVGYAAALCNKYRETPRGIYKNHLEELLGLVQGN